MKRYLLFYFLFVTMFLLSSCTSNENEVVSEPNATQFDVSTKIKTLQQLQALNDQLSKNAHVTRLSSGNSTLDADIIGGIYGLGVGESIGSLGKFFGVWGWSAYASCAFVGSAVGAVAFSWRYHKKKNGCSITNFMKAQMYDKVADYCSIKTNIDYGFENTEIPDSIFNQLFIPTGFDDIEKVGIAHNKILQIDPLELMNLQLGYGVNGGDLEKPIDDLLEPDRNPCVEALFDDNDYWDEYNATFNVFDNYYSNGSFDYSQYLDDNPLITTDATNVLRLFMAAIHAVPQTTNSMIQLVNNYIQTIETNNELTNTERRQLYVGFIIAVYSFDLWNGNPNVL